MANEWILPNVYGACYNTPTAGWSLSQDYVFEIGKYYSLIVTVNNRTKGSVILDSFDSKPTLFANGTYAINGRALQTSLSFSGSTYLGEVFDGCIGDISVVNTPIMRIEDGVGVVYEQPNNNSVQRAGYLLMYSVDWSLIENGTYKIVIPDDNINYSSSCICLKEKPCTILLQWYNNENTGGFNYTDLNFTQSLRVVAKQRNVFGKSVKRDVFRFSDGSKKILYAEKDQEYILVIREIPTYLHQALMLGCDYDHFLIDGVEYFVDQEDYQPKWRNSSELAPIELTVTLKRGAFINTNCS